MGARASSPFARTRAAALALALGLALTAALLLSAARAQAASMVTVEISNFAFQPASITIQVGDTVTWTNQDSAAHTATDTGSQALFDGVMDQGESFSYTFTQPGTINYICSFHPEMAGTVIVQSATASQLPDGAMAQPTGHETGQVFAIGIGMVLLFLSLLVAAAGAVLPRRAARS